MQSVPGADTTTAQTPVGTVGAKIRVTAGIGLRRQVGRALDHTAMKRVCRDSPKGGSPPDSARNLVLGRVPAEIKSAAANLIKLQAERHKADYDTNALFRKPQALARIAEAEAAFEAWDRVRTDPVTGVFLHALLFGEWWDR